MAAGEAILERDTLRALVSAALDRDVATVARLAFLRAFVRGHDAEAASTGTERETPEAAVLIEARNEIVLERLVRCAGDGTKAVSVLYGAMHMRDLEGRLRARGFQRVSGSEKWSRAFGVRAPAADAPDRDKAVPLALLALLALLGLDGADYVYTLVELTKDGARDDPQGLALALALYAARHAGLYQAFNKLLLGGARP